MTGVFSWQPGVGLVGRYQLLFLRSDRYGGREQLPVHVVLAPKFNQEPTPRMGIDLPGSEAVVFQPFVMAGWAVDRAASGGTGVDAIHVWAYPDPGSGTSPIFLGAATYGDARPDVGAVFGSQFTNSGYSLTGSGLAPGAYDLVVYAHSAVTGTFNNAQAVRITIN